MARADTLGDIKARKKIIIGIQGDNPPWGFVNTSGKPDGFDAEIGTAFAAFLGVDVEFSPLAVANRIPALVSGRVDVLFATMAMLPERAKAVQFSIPYVANQMSVVAPKATAVKAAADLGKLKIGVPRSSVQDNDVTRLALVSGQVDAVGANQFYIDRLNAAKPGVYENKLTMTALYNGACARLGDKAINEALNAFITKIRADGTLAKAYANWMRVTPPTFPATLEGVPFTVG
jgi:polar amino acid transport system substrate-binding protein